MSGEDPLAVQRGDYGRSLLPNLLFTLGYAVAGPAQYLLICAHPLGRFGIPPPPIGSPPITLFGHTFSRLPFLTALMSAVHSAKHIFWLNFLCRERMTTKIAFFGVLSHFISEAITSLVFTTASVNPMFSERYFVTGITIYMASVAVELLAELQRTAFKAKRENNGKICKTGLWGITRHINFTVNVMFGFGYWLVAGGALYSVATAGL